VISLSRKIGGKQGRRQRDWSVRSGVQFGCSARIGLPRQLFRTQSLKHVWWIVQVMVARAHDILLSSMDDACTLSQEGAVDKSIAVNKAVS
jgi:hypothetical protein